MRAISLVVAAVTLVAAAGIGMTQDFTTKQSFFSSLPETATGSSDEPQPRPRSSPAPAATADDDLPQSDLLTVWEEPDNHAVTANANTQVNEDERPKSPALAAYEKAAGDLAWKDALVEMAWQCGLRDGAWYRNANHMMMYRFQNMRSMRARLTDDEFAVADGYSKLARNNAISWYMGEPNINKAGCERVAAMPMATNDLWLYQ